MTIEYMYAETESHLAVVDNVIRDLQSFHVAVMYLSIKIIWWKYSVSSSNWNITKFIEIQYGSRRHLDFHDK